MGMPSMGSLWHCDGNTLTFFTHFTKDTELNDICMSFLFFLFGYETGFPVLNDTIYNTVIDLLSALCAKLFQNGGKFFKYFFFLLSAHFNKLLYIEGNEFKG